MTPAAYRMAIKRTLAAIEQGESFDYLDNVIAPLLRNVLDQPERKLTDELIADLWYANGTYHHHFARAIERWLRGEE